MVIRCEFVLFQFEVEASDQGNPPKVAKSRIVVVFRRDKDPRFNNLPRQQRVSENAANDSQVYDANGQDDDKKVSIGVAQWLHYLTSQTG